MCGEIVCVDRSCDTRPPVDNAGSFHRTLATASGERADFSKRCHGILGHKSVHSWSDDWGNLRVRHIAKRIGNANQNILCPSQLFIWHRNWTTTIWMWKCCDILPVCKPKMIRAEFERIQPFVWATLQNICIHKFVYLTKFFLALTKRILIVFQVRQRVLVSAFMRAIKDSFPPARGAGVLALATTQQYFLLSEVAYRILPALCTLTVDPDKTVREHTFKTLRGFLGKLERVSEDPSLRERMGKTNATFDVFFFFYQTHTHFQRLTFKRPHRRWEMRRPHGPAGRWRPLPPNSIVAKVIRQSHRLGRAAAKCLVNPHRWSIRRIAVCRRQRRA